MEPCGIFYTETFISEPGYSLVLWLTLEPTVPEGIRSFIQWFNTTSQCTVNYELSVL